MNAKLQKIEIRTHRKLSSLLAGDRSSVRRGRGFDFEEYRDYVYGVDDPRLIDWKASAKVPTRTLLKRFIEEKQLNIIIIIDTSASMDFPTKKHVLLQACASLAFSGLELRDSVGFVGFSNGVHSCLKTSRDRDRVYNFLEQLFERDFSGRTDLASPLERTGRNFNKGLAFFISDFPAHLLTNKVGEQLAGLNLNFDIIPLIVQSDLEVNIPDTRAEITVRDAETGQLLLISDIRSYRKELRRVRRRQENFFRGLQLDYAHVKDDLDEIVELFALRRFQR